MSSDIIAKIQVVPEPGQESEIAGRELRDFRRENFEQLAQLINMAVEVFKQELERTPQDAEALLELERVNLSFGVDVTGGMGLSLGSVFSANAQKGTTFQVNITLLKKS